MKLVYAWRWGRARARCSFAVSTRGTETDQPGSGYWNCWGRGLVTFARFATRRLECSESLDLRNGLALFVCRGDVDNPGRYVPRDEGRSAGCPAPRMSDTAVHRLAGLCLKSRMR